MKFLGRRIDDILSAIAFAEAGELETARELMRERTKVLLVLPGKASDRSSFTFAMNSAQRVKAAIEILLFTDRKIDYLQIEHFESVLRRNKVEYRIVRTSGCMKTKILERTSRRSDIQFVVAESMEVLRTDCHEEQRSLRGMLNELKCPLVLVSELEAA